MIEVICNDRLGKKIRVKCNADDTVGDLKKLLAAQTGTRPEKLRIQKWYTVYKDHITLEDYEIHDGMGLELYCECRVPQSLSNVVPLQHATHTCAARPLRTQTIDFTALLHAPPATAIACPLLPLTSVLVSY